MPEETKSQSPEARFASMISRAAEEGIKGRLSGKAGQEAASRVAMAFRAIAKRTPDIYGCTTASVADCVVKSATYNLFPGGIMPDVDLIVTKGGRYEKQSNGPDKWINIPYGEWTLDWRPSYRGLRRLVSRETGIDLEPMCVLEGDEFKWVAGLNPDIIHIPNVDPEAMDDVNEENLRCAYVVWTDPETKTKKFIVMRKGDILRARSKSESWKGKNQAKSPWATDFHPMVLKTVVLWAIRRVIPFDPNQIAVMEGAITAADDAMPQEAPAPAETPAPEVKTEKPAPASTADALNMVLEQRTVPESHQIAQDPEEVPEVIPEKVVVEVKAEAVAPAQQAKETVAEKRAAVAREQAKQRAIDMEAKVGSDAVAAIRKQLNISGLPVAQNRMRDDTLSAYVTALEAATAKPEPKKPEPVMDELPFDDETPFPEMV